MKVLFATISLFVRFEMLNLYIFRYFSIFSWLFKETSTKVLTYHLWFWMCNVHVRALLCETHSWDHCSFAVFQMQVLHVISFVIERVGVQIRPYANSLITYLPALWEESEDHNMLKCAILTTLIHLVQVMCNTHHPYTSCTGNVQYSLPLYILYM